MGEHNSRMWFVFCFSVNIYATISPPCIPLFWKFLVVLHSFPPYLVSMHYIFLLFTGTIYHRGWETLGGKVNSYERGDTETILVDQTCSTANAPFSSCPHRHRTCVQCTDSLTRPQNAISQLKCLCHPVSCLNLISFFLNVGGQIEVNAKRKETRTHRKEAVTCELRWSSLKPETIWRSRAPPKHLRPHVFSIQWLCCVSFKQTSSNVALQWWTLRLKHAMSPKQSHCWHAGQNLSKVFHESGACGRLAHASWNDHWSETHSTQDKRGIKRDRKCWPLLTMFRKEHLFQKMLSRVECDVKTQAEQCKHIRKFF